METHAVRWGGWDTSVTSLFSPVRRCDLSFYHSTCHWVSHVMPETSCYTPFDVRPSKLRDDPLLLKLMSSLGLRFPSIQRLRLGNAAMGL